MKHDVITEESILQMLKIFYARVRQDSILGPVFSKAMNDQWEAHTLRIADFWSTILLGSKSFQGNVFSKHMALPDIREEHFVQWLTLFNDTVSQFYSGDAATEFLTVADRIANSLQLGFFGKRMVTLEHIQKNVVT